MSANANWGRWIYASVSDHFNTAITTLQPTAKVYVEGSDKENDDLMYCEFRMDGPYITEMSRNWWKVWINVNIFCVAKRSGKDFHAIHTLTGAVANSFNNSIECFKFGTQVGDDSTSFACLQLDTKRGDDVLVSHFGQIDPDLLEMQATVDGCYEAFIDTSS